MLMSAHFLDVEGASVIATEQLLDTRDLLADLVEARAMGAVYGPAGVGKTFAVNQALGELPRADWVRTDFRSRPTTRYVRWELFSALGLGSRPPVSPVDTDLVLKAVLARRFRLLVIDEAQWLNRECFEYLRHLHDDQDTTFGLLFVGGDGCYEVLRREPMLDSRLYAHQRFQAMQPDEVVAVIPLYHAIYAGVEADLVLYVNQYCGHGNFRNWAKFTRHALNLCRQHGRAHLDKEVARNVFARFGGGHHAG
jgi:DNA transposition AAA+ family ATPase